MAFSISDKSSLTRLINNTKYASANERLSITQNENSFNDLLRDCFKEIGLASTDPTKLSRLDKKQIEYLVKTIQIQMNRRLFSVILDDNSHNEFSPSNILPGLGKGKNLSVNNVTEYSQVAPKNNVNNDKSDTEAIIEKAAKRYEVDPDLIRSVIKAESNFNSMATSPKGAMGLMQLMPETARDLGVKNSYDPEENIMGGTHYLKNLLDRYDGKVDLALAAYNWGMGNLEKNPHNLPQETTNYIARINNHYKNLKASA